MIENQVNFQSFIVCLYLALKLSKLDLQKKPVTVIPGTVHFICKTLLNFWKSHGGRIHFIDVLRKLQLIVIIKNLEPEFIHP